LAKKTWGELRPAGGVVLHLYQTCNEARQQMIVFTERCARLFAQFSEIQ
jgi:hypothetical protein